MTSRSKDTLHTPHYSRGHKKAPIETARFALYTIPAQMRRFLVNNEGTELMLINAPF
jgi:hypothetical protein